MILLLYNYTVISFFVTYSSRLRGQEIKWRGADRGKVAVTEHGCDGAEIRHR